ncbi:spore germination protein [Alicyclobacillus mengziensis]|uniref:Spore germination protein n=1 Tax=Alicyclobacillus mengziensis TaxID=2931921 RepID=A0A9X7VVS4_9BACL|nr:spore germination protein [Alicyclobacillus mengziensis]QSO46011.1 spore germination protein [Alicyclobacillus mengziensis]
MPLWSRQQKKAFSNLPIPPSKQLEAFGERKITGDNNQVIEIIRGLFGQNDDLATRNIHVFQNYEVTVLFMSNFVNNELVNENLLKPLLQTNQSNTTVKRANVPQFIMQEILTYSEAYVENSLTKIGEGLFRGNTVVLIQGLKEAIVVSTRSVDHRTPAQPETEQAIRGSRDGFIESIGVNMSLIRYRLQTPDLRMEAMEIGRLTKTKVVVCYIEGLADPDIVRRAHQRLSKIDIDGVLDAGTLEQYIEDNHWSPFPQIQNSERPDKCCAAMMEGRVVILTDGTPFALIVPSTFTQFYQVMDDYSERWIMGSLVRAVRLVSLMFSLIFPSLYVAVISFNPELIPTKFAVAVAGGRAGVPFPAMIEVLVMEISMEVLREATLRLPQQVGGALSIVGVLVVGQAAVSAGFVSPITVVVVALTTIGSFATPAYNAAIALRILRFAMILLAGTFGLYGIVVGMILILNHMLALRSFGVPFWSPYAPFKGQGMKDAPIRAPLWTLSLRPKELSPENDRRVSEATVAYAKSPPKRQRTSLVSGPRKGGK